MQTPPYKKYPYDEGETSKSQRSKDIAAAVLFALPAHASLKMLKNITDQEQRYSINLGFREIESCEIIINEVNDWDDPATRFGSIDIVFDPAYSKTGEVILKDFTHNTLYIEYSETIEMSSLEANELEQLLKETEFEYEKDPALEQAFEMSTHDFHIPQSDFHSALQDILRSLIESCLIKGLKFSSNIQADKIFSISYAHEKVLKHLNKPILTPPDEDNRDILETWNNRYHPKPVEVIPPKTKQLLQDIFNKK